MFVFKVFRSILSAFDSKRRQKKGERKDVKMKTLSFIINRFSVELKFVSRKKENPIFLLFDLDFSFGAFCGRFLWFDSRQKIGDGFRGRANDKLSDIHVSTILIGRKEFFRNVTRKSFFAFH